MCHLFSPPWNTDIIQLPVCFLISYSLTVLISSSFFIAFLLCRCMSGRVWEGISFGHSGWPFRISHHVHFLWKQRGIIPLFHSFIPSPLSLVSVALALRPLLALSRNGNSASLPPHAFLSLPLSPPPSHSLSRSRSLLFSPLPLSLFLSL